MHIVELDYVDYVNDNEQRHSKMAFNLNAWELSELTVEFPEGIGEYMEKALKEERNKDAFAVLKMLFVNAYGRRIKDGDRYDFVKNPKWLFSLLPSAEFEAFYLKLTTDTEFATDFWNKIVTPELLKRATAIAEAEGKLVEGAVAVEKTHELSIADQIKALQAKQAANE